MKSSKKRRYSKFLDQAFRRARSHSPTNSESADFLNRLPSSDFTQTPKKSRFSRFLERGELDVERPAARLAEHTDNSQTTENLDEETLDAMVGALSEQEIVRTYTADSSEFQSITENLIGAVFGSSGAPNKAAESAVFKSRNLEQELRHLQTKLVDLSSSTETSYILSALSQIERVLQDIGTEAKNIRREEASGVMAAVNELIESIKLCLKDWRTRYPDKSPHQIDNSTSFSNPPSARNEPALIAYCIALVSRVFHRASQRGAAFTLKMLKLFGRSLLKLSGGPNIEQTAVLDSIPESIASLEQKFNLDVKTVLYAVCPSCAFLHKLDNNPQNPPYPSHCSHKFFPDHPPCGVSLLESGHPVKVFEFYSFFDWFGRLLALPGVAQYGDRFCDEVVLSPIPPDDKTRTSDGRFYREFRDSDGGLFVADRGEEGRWFFLLYADFFAMDGKGARKRSSTGVMAITCLNLPPEIRNDAAYIYIPGIIQGPHEPVSTSAQHQHYLTPLVDELEIGYSRGIQCHSIHGLPHLPPYNRTHRVALAGLTMDARALRPFSSLADVGARNFCCYCEVWQTYHRLRTDFETWKPVKDEWLCEGAEKWVRVAVTGEKDRVEKARKAVVDVYGSRYCELRRLSYLDRTRQSILDPMHSWYMNVLEEFFSHPCALGLAPGDRDSKLPFVSFQYDFAFPPALSEIDTEIVDDGQEDQLHVLSWGHLDEETNSLRNARIEGLKTLIGGNPRILQGVNKIHNLLSQSRHSTDPGRANLLKKLTSENWAALLYVCNDLMTPPSAKPEIFQEARIPAVQEVLKAELANALLNWEIEEDTPFVWPHFTPRSSAPPQADWAPPLHSMQQSGLNTYRHLTERERSAALQRLGRQMKYNSAVFVGAIHRYLTQPIEGGQDGFTKLKLHLSGTNQDSLEYVCTDLNRLPLGISKQALIKALIEWRESMPLDRLPQATVDSSVLNRIQQVTRELIIPSWIHRPPPDVGTSRAGKLKADNWRVMFEYIVPVALISLWGHGSPVATQNASEMKTVLETCMYLTLASIVMAKRKLTRVDRERFRYFYREHIRGLKQHFPRFSIPTHHLAFHIYDFMDLFGNVHNFWCFPGERLIGRLQRIPVNHRTGQSEGTLLHSFFKGANFRQWLLQPDRPGSNVMSTCRKLVDKAFGYSIHTIDDKESQIQGSTHPEVNTPKRSKIPRELSQVLDEMAIGDVSLVSDVTSPNGFYHYTVPTAPAKGNSFICFRMEEDPKSEWVAGQIQYIFRQAGSTKLAVRRSIPRADTRVADPFKMYWIGGFEAKMVSSGFADGLEVLDLHQVIAHTLRWKMSSDLVVVLKAHQD